MAISLPKKPTYETGVPNPRTTPIPRPTTPVPAPPINTSPKPTSTSTITVPKNNSVVPAPPSTPKPTTTNMPIPTSTPVPAPPTNYGGKGNAYNEILYSKKQYDAGNKGWAANNATQYYSQLDPTEAAKIKAMNTAQLEAYINERNRTETAPAAATTIPAPSAPTTPSFTPVSDPGAFVPPPSSSTPQIPIPQAPAIPPLDMEAIGRYVDQQLAAEMTRQNSAADQAINAGKLTAQQQSEAIQRAVERLRGDITERRNVENVENQRRLSPFSGRSDYTLGVIEMQRGKQDQQISADQLQQEALIQQNLAQLQNEINAKRQALVQTQGAERERMIQSLRESERAYDMAQAQLEIDRYMANSQLRNTDFNQSLAAWQANRGAFEGDRAFDYGRYADMVNWTGYVPQYGASGANGFAANGSGGGMGIRTLQGQQVDLQNRQANLDAAFGYMDRTGRVITPQSDWSGYARQAASGNAPLTLDAQKFQESVRQFGVDTALKQAGLEQDAKQFAANQGLQWAQLSQRDKEFIADQAWRQKNYDLDIAKMNQPGDASGYINQIVDMYVAKDPYDGTVKVTNPTAMRNAIIALNLPDNVTDQYLIMYGLPIN